MIKEIRHIGIIVKDLEESMHFYAELLGFKVVKQVVESSEFIDFILRLRCAKVTTVKMKHPGFKSMIELLYYECPRVKKVDRKINHIGIGHVAFTVENLNYEYERLCEDGVFFLSEPKISPDGKAKVAFCQAPEGTFIEMVQILEN